MKLESIKLENYKAFKNPQLFEIRPLTILIGKNSSGKSVVSRLPILISQSLSGKASAPLDMQIDELDYGVSFVDLIHNKFPHGSVTFEVILLDDREDRIHFKVQVQNIAGSPIQVIRNIKVSSSDVNLTFDWILTETVSNAQRYNVSGDLTGERTINFKGFIPISIGDDRIQSFFDRIKTQIPLINYIGPFRDFPIRTYKHIGSASSNIGFNGKNTPQILGADYFMDKKIIEGVGSWFGENLGGWKLDIEKVLNFFEIVLISPDDPQVKVNIVDVGHGMSQVLPIIVRNFINAGATNSIDIIEQPELHLHPGAHANLAELFVNTVRREGSSFIIETHSENFILRIRNLVAKGAISKNDVQIYWVEDDERPGSELVKINLDENGNVSFWPHGVFSESLLEASQLRRAQREQQGNVSPTQ